MKEYKRLWMILGLIMVGSFILLGYFGKEIYNERPPIPAEFVDERGKTIYTEADILAGQSAWQSIGGMSVGTVWGHGAYQAPDWTADWIHREVLGWLDQQAQREFGKPYDQLSERDQATLHYDAQQAFRKNTYDQATGKVTLSADRVRSIEAVAAYYDKLFGSDPELHKLREAYAMKEDTLPSAEKRAKLNAFFFWSAWAASTNRPNLDVTYTNNWPHEPLIGNHPSAENVIWSISSVVTLIFGIGSVIWIWAFFTRHEHDEIVIPERDPLTLVKLTPSQKALGKYLLIVAALFFVQVMLGGFTAHYTVEGQDFYGIPVADWLPYSLTRTWHIQSAIFWIATGFLAAGLFLVPIINGGKDPKFQALGVNALFVALFIVVGGSYGGNFLALSHAMPAHLNFWFGHQGYEYLDLGRFWQILLMVGLLLWLFLMLRCTVSAFKDKNADKNLLAIFVASMVGVGVFYAPGLLYGEHDSLTVMDYWRWWVVHLWVEGFFEVFATVALAFIFYNLGLVSRKSATVASLVAASLFMVGGVPGTFHHLYFAGTTTPIMAVGASFSALEVVPLILLGKEAHEHWAYQHATPWMKRLRWPLMCFVAVAFWNMIGAGVFGFLINPPISLFYLQGLNTTAVHAHAALFGVYGFLALGFVLLVARYLKPDYEFEEKLMSYGFWMLNLGLVGMIATSLLPAGVIQIYAAIHDGLWMARSEGFMQQDSLVMLRWIRTISDLVFIAGGCCVAWQATKIVFSKGTGKKTA